MDIISTHTQWNGFIIVLLVFWSIQYKTIATSDFLVVTDDLTRGIIRIDLDSGLHIPLPIQNTHYPWGVAYDPSHDIVYWSDRGNKWLAKAGVYNAVTLPAIVTRLCKGSFPQGVAIDHTSQLLFYVDTGQRQIGALSLSNPDSHRVILEYGIDRPKTLALDYVNRYMYWTDSGSGRPPSVPRIERAYMDGTHKETVIDRDMHKPEGIAVDMHGETEKLNLDTWLRMAPRRSRVLWPGDLTEDDSAGYPSGYPQSAQRLYWTDEYRIESSTLDGRDRVVIIEDRATVYRSVAVSIQHVYIAGHSGVQRVNKAGVTTEVTHIAREAEFVVIGMTLHINNQTHTGSDSTCQSTGVSDGVLMACDHLCIPTPVGRSCFCPLGSYEEAQSGRCIKESIIDMDQLNVMYNISSVPTTLVTTLQPIVTSSESVTSNNMLQSESDASVESVTNNVTQQMYDVTNADPNVMEKLDMTFTEACPPQDNTVLIVIIITSGVLVIFFTVVIIWCVIRRRTKSLHISGLVEYGNDPKVCLKKAGGTLQPRPISNGHKYESIDSVRNAKL